MAHARAHPDLRVHPGRLDLLAVGLPGHARQASPRIQQAQAEDPDPASRRSWPEPGRGLLTTDQVVPFHDSINVFPLPSSPTALQEAVDTHDTPNSRPVTFGLAGRDQVLPFQDWINGR